MSDNKPLLDKKRVLQEAPLLAKPLLGGLISWINRRRVSPVISVLVSVIDWEKLLNHVVSNFAKDDEAATEASKQLVEVVSKKAEGSES